MITVTSDYEKHARAELRRWQERMLARPGLWNRATHGVQRRVNRLIPEKVHEAITAVIKQMIRAVLAGSNYTASAPLADQALALRERLVLEKVDRYRKTAAAEGGLTGAGGFLLGLADFPLLLGIELKLLFEIAALYGHTGDDFTERVYILFVLQLAFSSDEHRRDIYLKMLNWREQRKKLPASLDELDWRTFQQEYRDYIDLAKLAQLLPVIGAPVGVIANNQLVKKLGLTAMNAYRMRWFADNTPTDE